VIETLSSTHTLRELYCADNPSRQQRWSWCSPPHAYIYASRLSLCISTSIYSRLYIDGSQHIVSRGYIMYISFNIEMCNNSNSPWNSYIRRMLIFPVAKSWPYCAVPSRKRNGQVFPCDVMNLEKLSNKNEKWLARNSWVFSHLSSSSSSQPAQKE
jgi:hypothetical protein